MRHYVYKKKKIKKESKYGPFVSESELFEANIFYVCLHDGKQTSDTLRFWLSESFKKLSKIQDPLEPPKNLKASNSNNNHEDFD